MAQSHSLLAPEIMAAKLQPTPARAPPLALPRPLNGGPWLPRNFTAPPATAEDVVMAAVALEVSAIGARSLGGALANPHCERRARRAEHDRRRGR